MKLLIIDNYDSFIYNIVGLLERVAADRIETYASGPLQWDVVLNDHILEHLEVVCHLADYSGVIISPGPGLPCEAGEMPWFLNRHYADLPILGICLGCQAISENFGGELANLKQIRHGHSSVLRNIDPTDPLVGDVGGQVGRYHSWVIRRDAPGKGLRVTSEDEEGNVMSVCHERLPIFGVQYHPESVITEQGDKLIRNFIDIIFQNNKLQKC